MVGVYSESEVAAIVSSWFTSYGCVGATQVDPAVVDYLAGILTDQDLLMEENKDELVDVLEPILEEALPEQNITKLCHELANKVRIKPTTTTTTRATHSTSATQDGADGASTASMNTTTTSDNGFGGFGGIGGIGGIGVGGDAPLRSGPFIISEVVAKEGEGDARNRTLLSSEQLIAQYRVPTLPDISDKEKAKLQRRKQRQKELAEKELEQHREALREMMKEAESGNVPTIVRNQGGNPIVDLNLESISVDIAGKELVNDSNLTLARGRRYGLVGRNGTGKTTLLRHLCSGAENVRGIPNNCQILHVAQEVTGENKTVLESVLDCDIERRELLEKEAKILKQSSAAASDSGDKKGQGSDQEALLEKIYERLNEIDAHSAPAKASKILYGLSFDEEMQKRHTKTFSGGWRMRIALARALFVQPDLLLLDEPTNHLDLHAVIWLEEYLLQWPTILVVVSHSRGFLDYVCTDIVHLHSQKLVTYSGNYSNFEKTRAERLRNERKAAESQDAKRKHIEEFINKFRCNAKRATLVQSRIKALKRMAEISVVADDPEYIFTFPDPGEVSGSLLSFDEVSFGYKDGPALFDKVSFGIDADSRIALVGANGAGKTTLLKLMTGVLQCTSGYVNRSSHVRIATFSQHHVDGLDLALCPLEYLLKEFPNTSDEIMRGHLSSFGIPQELQVQNMYKMSGGQKSRVAFARITFSKPHILLLDEPSNHLDMDAVDALIQGLNDFKGCVVLVSHDEHLINASANELWVCAGKTVKLYNDSFEAYKKSLSAGK